MKYCSQCWGLPTTLELRGYFPVTWEFLGEDIIFQISFALPWHSSVCVCVCVCMLSRSVYLTLRNPMDYSPPYSSVHGILQARILECVAISFSRGSFQPRDRTLVSCISYIGSQILYHHQGSLLMEQGEKKKKAQITRPKRRDQCLAIQRLPWVARAALGVAEPVKFQSYSFCDTVVPIWRDPEKLWVCTQWSLLLTSTNLASGKEIKNMFFSHSQSV